MSKTYRNDPYTREEKPDGKVKKSELKRIRLQRRPKEDKRNLPERWPFRVPDES